MNINEVLMQMSMSLYKTYTNGELNIVGVRSKDTTPNVFNDQLFVFWYEGNDMKHKEYQITTDPGLAGMVKPVNAKGTAILVADQYIDTYVIGKHKGKYDSLVQRGGEVKVYRDNDKDAEHDKDKATIESGWFGINIHRAKDEAYTTTVGRWSYGCQVFANDDEFEEFMQLCYKHKEQFGNKFTYTLLEE